MKNEKVYKMAFAKVYPLLVNKVEKKSRTKDELNQVIYWLTGYDEEGLKAQLEREVDYRTFLKKLQSLIPMQI